MCDAETIALLCDLNVRRGEYTSAVDAVRIGLERFPDDPSIAHALVRLAAKVKSPGKKSLGPNAPEIRDNVSKLLGCPVGQIDVEAYVTAYAGRAQEAASLAKILSAIRSRAFLDKSAATSLESIGALLASGTYWQGRNMTASVVLETTKVKLPLFFVSFVL